MVRITVNRLSSGKSGRQTVALKGQRSRVPSHGDTGSGEVRTVEEGPFSGKQFIESQDG